MLIRKAKFLCHVEIYFHTPFPGGIFFWAQRVFLGLTGSVLINFKTYETLSDFTWGKHSKCKLSTHIYTSQNLNQDQWSPVRKNNYPQDSKSALIFLSGEKGSISLLKAYSSTQLTANIFHHLKYVVRHYVLNIFLKVQNYFTGGQDKLVLFSTFFNYKLLDY